MAFVLFRETTDTLGLVASSGVSGSMDASPALAGGLAAKAQDGLLHLFSEWLQAHPLLVFLGIGGALCGVGPGVRRWCLSPLLLLAFVAGWGRIAFPNLQASRMAVPLMACAIIPAAFAMQACFASRTRAAALGQALIVALLVLTAHNVARVYGNESPARYHILGDDVRRLSAFLAEHCPPGGRVLFAGRVVHAAGRGHTAPLPLLTQREMMGCDYYAFPTSQVEYEYPPRPFRATPDGLLRFLDLHNVRLVITYHEKWAAAFRREPERYEPLPVLQIGNIPWHAFRVRGDNSMFLRGEGRVAARFNRLDVELRDPSVEAVIRYNWDDRLVADGKGEIFPFDAGDGIRFIGIRPGGGPRVAIRLGGWL
jgi:hypothetical protein